MPSRKITGIVTAIVRHTDRNNVVTLFTRSHGRIAFLSPAGSGKAARLRNARLHLMAVIETEVTMRENKDLQFLGAFSLAKVWRDLYFNPVKSSIVILMSEFLNRYLRDAAPDEMLWDYVFRMLEQLDAAPGIPANFHLCFLMGFLHHAGIAPDLSEADGTEWFDMRAGILTDSRPFHSDYLTPTQTRQLALLLRMNMSNYKAFRFTGTQRSEVVELLMRYYAIHFPGMAGMQSPDILSEIWEV